MAKYVSEDFQNYCSCRWQKDRTTRPPKGFLIIDDDSEKIEKIESSPMFKRGIIKRVDLPRTEEEVKEKIEATEEKPVKKIYTYPELQRLAAKKGIKSFGVRRKELEKLVGV